MFTVRWALVPIFAILGLVAVPVSAATTRNIDYTLNFLGHAYFESTIYKEDPNTDTGLSEVKPKGTLLEQDDIWGLPRLFPQFSIGDTLSFSASLSLPDASGGKGTALSCSLGGLNCAQGNPVATYDDAGSTFSLGYGYNSGFWGTLKPGEVLSWNFVAWDCPASGPQTLENCAAFTTAATTSGNLARWGIMQARFAVVQTPMPAPVPLPAPALLLPVGLIGLAALRRRRKGVSAA